MRKLTIPVVFVLLTALSSGCEPRGNDDRESTKPVHCTVVVDGPKAAEDRDSFAGRVRYRCATPGAESLVLKIKIERRDGDVWRSVASRTHTLKGKATYAAELKYQSKDLSISCRTGTFRTVVDWSRTSRKDTEGDNLISGAVKDPCRPPIFG
ncbi:hypothetical protein [Catellatospora citrea]|uniref:Uncharacterized protein n=1 Tax=Catellatospora citrea TaxID=53366 RepID=A0A8J3KCK9_9ACTN|nr:hypothetical protein [Catellatospora citrea]RKE09733.1 hypothetical protein C8E86_4624 [Catellatospora citrea]GIG00717.1 hypothetical protein Cci01nite_58100 [Catellatospora citrea]